MTHSPAVLAKDPDEPICRDCVTALGGKPRDKLATVSVQTCCMCANERPCEAIRDNTWPVTLDTVHGKRPLHAQPDDYSELELLLGRGM